jgi:transcriptional regulator with XRE-family HTH domain
VKRRNLGDRLRRRLKRRVDRALKERSEILVTRLLEAREVLRLTQAAVAKEFGRDQSFISKIEKGKRSPTFVEVERLASIYGKTLSEFWGDVSRLRLR